VSSDIGCYNGEAREKKTSSALGFACQSSPFGCANNCAFGGQNESRRGTETAQIYANVLVHFSKAHHSMIHGREPEGRAPGPSHHSALSRYPRRSRNTKIWPPNGSRCSFSCTNMAKPLAHVGDARSKPHPRSRRRRDHCPSGLNTRCSGSISTSRPTLITTPLARRISIARSTSVVRTIRIGGKCAKICAFQQEGSARTSLSP